MAKVNAKESIIGIIRQGQTFVTKDLKAIPKDKQNSTFGGCTRSALNMVAECGGNCRVMGQILKGEAVGAMTDEARMAHYNSFDTEEKVLAHLNENVEYLIGVVQESDNETFGDDCTGFPYGQMSRFGVAQLPGVHMMYHDGQLNYIQTLLNDEQVHWRD